MANHYQPVGTIIASILTYEQLTKTLGEGATCDKNSTYAPCDGRLIAQESVLGKIMLNTVKKLNIPDLRGKFIRGLNEMDPLNQPEQPFDEKKFGDPDGRRTVMGYQSDAVMEHTHNYSIGNFQKNADGGDTRSYVGADYNQALQTSGAGLPAEKKNSYETRPRNVAVYFYIKIN